MKPIVTFIHGPKGSGKTRLANRLADERRHACYTCAIVDANGESVAKLCEGSTVNYLYICSLDEPRREDQKLIFSTLRLGIPTRLVA